MDMENVMKSLDACVLDKCSICAYNEKPDDHLCCIERLCRDAHELLKEQASEIRQLRLALDIAKGTCKGIKSGGGQFADMPTMQSAT